MIGFSLKIVRSAFESIVSVSPALKLSFVILYLVLECAVLTAHGTEILCEFDHHKDIDPTKAHRAMLISMTVLLMAHS